MANSRELTPEQTAQIKPWAAKWMANALNTQPVDPAEWATVRHALQQIYTTAEQEVPPEHRFQLVSSPFVARFAAAIAAAVWWLRQEGEYDESKALGGPIPRTRMARELHSAVRQLIATKPLKRGIATPEQLARMPRATDDSPKQWFSAPVAELKQVLTGFVGRKYREFALECLANTWRMHDGGNQWSGDVAYITFQRYVLKNTKDVDYSKWHWYEQAATAGPRYMHAQFCVVCDRPELLTFDEQDRPHAEDGPFVRWRDGGALYSWHGVSVPGWVLCRPEQLTARKIHAEENMEVRRAMLERMGWERYLEESKAEVIQRDDFGTLLELPALPGEDEPLRLVRVTNATPEPDGSYKDYLLRVAPTASSAHEAVAQSWELGALDYEPEVET